MQNVDNEMRGQIVEWWRTAAAIVSEQMPRHTDGKVVRDWVYIIEHLDNIRVSLAKDAETSGGVTVVFGNAQEKEWSS